MTAINKIIAYTYDGSFDGLMSCVFESFDKKENPEIITLSGNTLLMDKFVATDLEKAERVKKSIDLKMGHGTLNTVKTVYLSDFDYKEKLILDFLRLGYRVGKKLNYLMGDEIVAKINKTEKLVRHEKGHLVEFIRFTDLSGALVSVIDPRHFVLPLLAPHFTTRYPNEQFMIYDRTHGMALMHIDRKSMIIPIEDYQMPEVSEEEVKYQKLWKLFYDTVEIKERHNERCRMGHMPKYFWKNMTEFTVIPDKKKDF